LTGLMQFLLGVAWTTLVQLSRQVNLQMAVNMKICQR
jgi:hypothetical protein